MSFRTKFRSIFPLLSLLILLFSGCFEIVEDVTVHKNGSGTFFYTINLSQSKERIDGLMKMDSTDGYRVPQRKEIDADILKVKTTIGKSPGITNVVTSSDWVNYIFTLKFDFNSINNLNLAVETVSQELTSDHKRIPEAADNFAFTGSTFDRKSHYDAKTQAPKLTAKDKEILRAASYTCIFRFDDPVNTCSNKDSKVSKSGKSVMTRLNMLDLALGEKSIINKILLK
ncbi:MAG TPA: hypothetical protein VFJ43_07650 [Bacteroidia bacterium]|nr:hypothetical protein [Bacteroidia bacterium]